MPRHDGRRTLRHVWMSMDEIVVEAARQGLHPPRSVASRCGDRLRRARLEGGHVARWERRAARPGRQADGRDSGGPGVDHQRHPVGAGHRWMEAVGFRTGEPRARRPARRGGPPPQARAVHPPLPPPPRTTRSRHSTPSPGPAPATPCTSPAGRRPSGSRRRIAWRSRSARRGSREARRDPAACTTRSHGPLAMACWASPRFQWSSRLEPPNSHGRDHDGSAGIALTQALHRGREIVKVREAVPDEENPQGGTGVRRRGAGAAARHRGPGDQSSQGEPEKTQRSDADAVDHKSGLVRGVPRSTPPRADRFRAASGETAGRTLHPPPRPPAAEPR